MIVSYPSTSTTLTAADAAAPWPADRHPVAVYLAGRSPSSRRPMRAALEDAARLLTGSRLTAAEVPWHQLDYPHMAALRSALPAHAYQPGKTYAPATANRILTAVRGVLAECRRLGYMSHDQEARARDIRPIPGLRLPKGRMLSAEELQRLFQACAQDPSPAGRRDAAMLAALTLTGPRRAELIALDLVDYDPASGTLLVRAGKGNKDRRLFGNAHLAAALAKWLAIRGDTPGPLFLPLTKGGRLCGHRLTDKAVTWILQRCARQAGVNAFSPHDLRRTCISRLLDAGADLVTVADLAGHVNTTTAKYDRRGNAAKQAAMARPSIPFVPLPLFTPTAAPVEGAA